MARCGASASMWGRGTWHWPMALDRVNLPGEQDLWCGPRTGGKFAASACARTAYAWARARLKYFKVLIFDCPFLMILKHKWSKW
jgi:hypothetical protein